MIQHLSAVEISAFALVLRQEPQVMEALAVAPGWRGNFQAWAGAKADQLRGEISETQAEVRAAQQYCNGLTRQVIRVLDAHQPAGVVKAELVSRSLKRTEMAFHHVAPFVSFADGRRLVIDYWPTRDLQRPEVSTLAEWLGHAYRLIEAPSPP